MSQLDEWQSCEDVTCKISLIVITLLLHTGHQWPGNNWVDTHWSFTNQGYSENMSWFVMQWQWSLVMLLCYNVVLTSDCLVSLSLLSPATATLWQWRLPVCHTPGMGHLCSACYGLVTTAHTLWIKPLHMTALTAAFLQHRAPGPAGPTSAVHKITTQSSACQQFSNFSHHKITLF